jgi:hypothetical protein
MKEVVKTLKLFSEEKNRLSAELETLIDKVKGKFGNYIDADVFPNNNGLWFWSCSAGLEVNDAWIVSFFLGDSYDDNLQDRYAVRLVRR